MLKKKRDELARLIRATEDPVKRAKGEKELAKIDKMIESKKFDPASIVMIIQLILALLKLFKKDS